MKPILFNADMVRSILENRKTVTRRVVKPQPRGQLVPTLSGGCWPGYFEEIGTSRVQRPPYRPGNILYVRETWQNGFGGTYLYKADAECDLFMNKEGNLVSNIPWCPSIHMPREAARIFLRVTDVRVERLQDITDEQALREGVPEDTDYPLDSQIFCPVCKGVGLVGALHPVSLGYMEVDCPHCDTPTKRFANFWNSTLKPANRAIYGWDANPWVWVIEFERCEMPEGG